MNAIQKEILNLGHSAMQPQYHPIVVPEIVDRKHVLVSAKNNQQGKKMGCLNPEE